jgi:hypothetical protein
VIYHLNILPNLKLVIYVDFFNLGYLSPAEEHLPSLLWYCQRVPAYPAQLLWRPLPTLPQSCWGVSTYLAYSGTARECQPTQPSCCGVPYLCYLSPAGECPPTYATSVLLGSVRLPMLPQSCWGVSAYLRYLSPAGECPPTYATSVLLGSVHPRLLWYYQRVPVSPGVVPFWPFLPTCLQRCSNFPEEVSTLSSCLCTVKAVLQVSPRVSTLSYSLSLLETFFRVSSPPYQTMTPNPRSLPCVALPTSSPALP